MRKEFLAAGIACLLFPFSNLRAAEARTNSWPLRFLFGVGTPTPEFTEVRPDTTYSNERGYGFEPGANFNLTNSSQVGLSSDQPFLFSVAVPEGNYRVTVGLRNPKASADTTVKAELRRLMLEQVHGESDVLQMRLFAVNVRQPKIVGDREVRLTPREKTSE